MFTCMFFHDSQATVSGLGSVLITVKCQAVPLLMKSRERSKTRYVLTSDLCVTTAVYANSGVVARAVEKFMLQFHACRSAWCYVFGHRKGYLQKGIVGVINIFPMFAEEIAMCRQSCLDLLVFDYSRQSSDSYATIRISPFEHKGAFDFRILPYLFNLFTPRVRCYPDFVVKTNQGHRSDLGLIAIHSR